MMLYHATFTRNVPLIRRVGLLPSMPPIWTRRDGSAYHTGDYVYAFDDDSDAILWAAKMGWAFFTNSGSSETCILEVRDPHSWRDDWNDPLGRAGARGKWLRRAREVAPSSIGAVTVLSPSLVKTIVAQRQEEIRQQLKTKRRKRAQAG